MKTVDIKKLLESGEPVEVAIDRGSYLEAERAWLIGTGWEWNRYSKSFVEKGTEIAVALPAPHYTDTNFRPDTRLPRQILSTWAEYEVVRDQRNAEKKAERDRKDAAYKEERKIKESCVTKLEAAEYLAMSEISLSLEEIKYLLKKVRLY